MANIPLTVQQIQILKYTHDNMTFREIAEKLDVAVNWIQKQRSTLERLGYLRNARPGKALGWVVSKKGIELLLEEGILKERSNGDS